MLKPTAQSGQDHVGSSIPVQPIRNTGPGFVDSGAPDNYGSLSQRDAWWTLAIVSALYVVSYLNRFVMTLVVPDMQASLHISDFQMGIVLGPAFAVSYAAFGIPFGWAADRWSRRMVILGGTIVFAASTAATGLAGSFPALLAWRICIGVGESSLSPAALSLIANKFTKGQLTTAISIFSTGPKIGTAVAFAAGSGIVAAAEAAVLIVPLLRGAEPWRIVFLVVTLPPLLLGLLCLTFREPRRLAPGREHPGDVGALRFMIDQRALMFPMLTGFGLLLICGQALISWTPAYLERVLHWSALGFGPVLGLVGMVGAGSLVVKGMIMDRLFTRGLRDVHIRFYTWLLIATLPVSIATFLVPGRIAFVACYAVLGVITIPCLAYASVAIQMVSPPHLRGRVFAALSIPLALLGGVGPPLVGALTDRVFGDASKVGLSLTILLAIALPAATIALRLCLPALRLAVDANERLGRA